LRLLRKSISFESRPQLASVLIPKQPTIAHLNVGCLCVRMRRNNSKQSQETCVDCSKDNKKCPPVGYFSPLSLLLDSLRLNPDQAPRRFLGIHFVLVGLQLELLYFEDAILATNVPDALLLAEYGRRLELPTPACLAVRKLYTGYDLSLTSTNQTHLMREQVAERAAIRRLDYLRLEMDIVSLRPIYLWVPF
jgi:hypothetical protein